MISMVKCINSHNFNSFKERVTKMESCIDTIKPKYQISNPFVYTYPIIYVYIIQDEDHEGLVKIGMTSGDFNIKYDQIPDNDESIQYFACKRIKQQTKTAAVRKKLCYCTIGMNINGEPFFDKDVHATLKRNLINHKDFKEIDIDGGVEWFELTPIQAIDYIKATKEQKITIENRSSIKDVLIWPSQQKAINDAINGFMNSNQFLWACKMRFGKTYTAMQLIIQSFANNLNFNRVIIFTNRPGVQKGWYDEFKSSMMYTLGFKFYAKNIGEPIDKVTTFSPQEKVICFYSMQDLKGSSFIDSNKKDKNHLVIDTKWDLIIIDEADEGSTSILGQELINALKVNSQNAKWLYLSGTPYSILNQFKSSEVFTWNYTDEQEAKEKFENQLNNPYANQPELRIYLINLLKDLDLTNQNYVGEDDDYFSFEEFFKCKKDSDEFEHELTIKAFLDLLVNQKKQEYPFSNEEYREYFKHTFWYLPNVASCNALEKLLNEHIIFKNFKILNVAGKNSNSLRAWNDVLEAIDKYKYTITLSCGRLTRGVTVGQWTAILYLCGGSNTSASQYMQTIFRVQSAYTDKITGKKKEIGYVFDFAPQRALVIQDKIALFEKELKPYLSKEKITQKNLQFMPVIANENNQFVAYDARRLVDEIRKNTIEIICNSGFTSPKLLKKSILSNLTQHQIDLLIDINKKSGISSLKTYKQYLNDNGIQESSSQTKTINKQQESKEKGEKEEQKKDLISALLTIQIRLPLLIFGTYDINQRISLKYLTDDVDDESWDEFMPKSVSKEKFNELTQCFDEELFDACSRQIIKELDESTKLPIPKRIEKISRLFATFHNPEKEVVLTPWRVINLQLGLCIGGWNFFDKSYTNNVEPHFIDLPITNEIYNPNAKVLDIYSKTGLYSLYNAFTFFKLYKEKMNSSQIKIDDNLLWQQIIENNIFALCQTKMATKITTRTLIGYDAQIKPNIFLVENLINLIQNDQWDEIVIEMKKQNNKNADFTFNAIVGNPPYTVHDSPNNPRSQTPVYPRFVELALKLKPKYFTFIIPGKWETGEGKGLKEFAPKMLNGKFVSEIYRFPNSKEIFQNVKIGGSICIFLADLTKQTNKPKISNYISNDNEIKFEIAKTTSFQDNDDEEERKIVFPNVILKSIWEKVYKSSIEFINSITKTRNPYGIENQYFKSKFINNQEIYFEEKFPNSCAIWGTNDQHDPQRYLLYCNINQLKPNAHLNMWKVFVGRNYGIINCYPTDNTVLAPPILAGPNTACTDSFLEIGGYDQEITAKHLYIYIYIASSLDVYWV